MKLESSASASSSSGYHQDIIYVIEEGEDRLEKGKGDYLVKERRGFFSFSDRREGEEGGVGGGVCDRMIGEDREGGWEIGYNHII